MFRETLLCLLQILVTQTDEDHPLTREEIDGQMKHMGLDVTKNTFYEYVKAFRSVGLDVRRTHADGIYRWYYAGGWILPGVLWEGSE